MHASLSWFIKLMSWPTSCLLVLQFETYVKFSFLRSSGHVLRPSHEIVTWCLGISYSTWLHLKSKGLINITMKSCHSDIMINECMNCHLTSKEEIQILCRFMGHLFWCQTSNTQWNNHPWVHYEISEVAHHRAWYDKFAMRLVKYLLFFFVLFHFMSQMFI